MVTLSACAAITIASLDAYLGTRYCIKLIRNQTRPRIATWLIFELGVAMSLIAYFSSHDHSVSKAALNVMDAAVVSAILITLLFRQRGSRIAFTRNEQFCLVLSCVTLLVWWLTHSPWIGVAGFQIVMSIAYIPTIENVWHWHPGPAPEPAETWSVNAIAALIGVAANFVGPHHDYLALLYPLRALVLCSVVVLLILRWQGKTAKTVT